MALSVVPVVGGEGSLGDWGSVRLTGREAAIVKSTCCEDIEVPRAFIEALVAGVAVLADDVGRLLLLPYAGEWVGCLDLARGGLAYKTVALERIDDEGLRMASVLLVPSLGVVYLTECSICLFDVQLNVSWRRDADLLGWFVEGVQGGRIVLVSSEWDGREFRRTISAANGCELR